MNTSAPAATLLLDGAALPDRSLIGGKAWSIANMMRLGLNVPPAFVVTTTSNVRYAQEGKLWPSLVSELAEGVGHLERESGRQFGGTARPLLVSVRSGAAVSMPGMMDTVLNLGVNDEVEAALAQECGDAAFAADTHKRFLMLYASIVLNSEVSEDDAKTPATVRQALAEQGLAVPTDPIEQLHAAVEAVFQSWNSRRARRYRDHHGISHDLGTAVTVQAMVFGNLNDRSGTGVLFSRNPLTGERVPFGEFLGKAQGEDVVSGRFTPQPLDVMRERLSEAHRQLLDACSTLEEVNSEVQDIEFTVEDGKLFILQSRTAKLAPLAAARTSVDFVREGHISRDAALQRISPDRLRLLLAPSLGPETIARHSASASGEGACPGVGIGHVVTDADEAETRIRKGERIVLARPTTSPNDLHGMIGAAAIVTEEGGSTSHAAVVSRALGVPCVVGCGSNTITALAGLTVTVDGGTGMVFQGALPIERTDEREDPVLAELYGWASERSPLKVIPPSDPLAASALDVSDDEQACDPATVGPALERLLKGQAFMGVRGGAIATDAGMQAAVRLGLSFVVAEPMLPPLLAAAHAAKHRTA